MPRFVYAIALAIVLGFLLNLKNRRVRAQAWSGTVLEFRHQRPSVTRDEDRRGEEWVTIVCRNDEGATHRFRLRVRVLREFLPGLKIGDRLVKHAGSYLPIIETPELPATSVA